MKNYHKLTLGIIFIALLNACATYKTQIKNRLTSTELPDKEIEYTFYLIGNAGNSEIGTFSIALQSLKKELSKASKKSTDDNSWSIFKIP